MSFKIEKIAAFIVLLLTVSGIWIYSTFNDSTINERLSTATSSIPPTSSSPLSTPVKKPPTATTPPPKNNPVAISKQLASPEIPIKREPGTTLSQKILDNLGLEKPILEEQIFYVTATPNDVIYPQWYTTIINAPTAWDTSAGSSSTIVADIDTGYALDHEDLSSAWLINTGEQGMTTSGDICWTGTATDKQTNNCDDDNNGYKDDWRGWDFANNDNNPQAGDNYTAGATHGTKTAGLIGGRGNNSVGTASVNWNTRILPLQALHDEGYGFSTDITAAIYYAVNAGADVINMSLGGPSPDSFTRAAVQYALANNVIVVVSSGNCGANQTDPSCVGFPSPGGMGYPASYPETIAVGATTSSDIQASFSSWGDALDLVAPGSGTIQTPSWSTSNQISLYATSSYGTSFSSPIVAGAIGIIKGQFRLIKKNEIIALLANSSDKVTGMGSADWTPLYGYGRLNINSLLIEMSRYQSQLLKYGGQISSQNSTNKPLINTNTGHTTASGIILSTPVNTYCVTAPNTLCSMQLKKRNSTTIVNFDALRANNQGIAVFNWSKSDASAGTWDATVTSGSQVSVKEKIVIL